MASSIPVLSMRSRVMRARRSAAPSGSSTAAIAGSSSIRYILSICFWRRVQERLLLSSSREGASRRRLDSEIRRREQQIRQRVAIERPHERVHRLVQHAAQAAAWSDQAVIAALETFD